jgi:hypothetical protein
MRDLAGKIAPSDGERGLGAGGLPGRGGRAMDGERFDRLARALANRTSRRSVVKWVASGLFGATLGVVGRAGTVAKLPRRR